MMLVIVWLLPVPGGPGTTRPRQVRARFTARAPPHDRCDLVPWILSRFIGRKLDSRLSGLLFEPGEQCRVRNDQIFAFVFAIEHDGGRRAAAHSQRNGNECQRREDASREAALKPE